MAEFGIIAPQGAGNVQQLILRLADPDDTCIPDRARAVLLLQVDQLRDTERHWPGRPAKQHQISTAAPKHNAQREGGSRCIHGR
jgi:hypothetical protein